MSNQARQHWQMVLTKSNSEHIYQNWNALNIPIKYDVIQPANVSMLMVKAKTGGFGNAFNLSEVTVVRCVIQTDAGYRGIVTQIGRDTQKALVCAQIDAMLLSEHKDIILQQLINPLEMILKQNQQALYEQAQSTKVDFFTMVRGESE